MPADSTNNRAGQAHPECFSQGFKLPQPPAPSPQGEGGR